MADFAKAALNTWCSKKKLKVHYDIADVTKDTEGVPSFHCETSVEGINYVSTGNGQSKKVAGNESALSMLAWLVNNNHLSKIELADPCFTMLKIHEVLYPRGEPISLDGFTGHEIGVGENQVATVSSTTSTSLYSGKAASTQLQEFDEQHGNITLDNAKKQLHQFMQVHNIKAEYEYESCGPAHQKMFTATIAIRVKGSEFTATEKSHSKMDASRLCAWKVCQQLLKEGLIEKFDPNAPSKRQLLKNNFIYEFLVSSSLKEQMMATCSMVHHYNTSINPGTSTAIYGNPGAPFFNPLALSAEAAVAELNASTFAEVEDGTSNNNLLPSNLSWCPPQAGFNPWTENAPDDPVFSGMSQEAINHYLQEQFFRMVSDGRFQAVLKTRSQLPIYLIKEQVISLIANHSVLVIKGSTGCGKTTQVPQFILDSYLRQGQGAHCSIVVTQPRRISAVSISERVAFERSEALAAGRSSVGYSVRFEHVSPRSSGSVLFCTTGHLLRRIRSGLRGISHLVIDEVHERDTSTDLLLVMARDMIRQGSGLKVIVMSATVGVHRLKQYFDDCHVLEVEGTLFPVERLFLEDTIERIKWRPTRLTYVEDDKDVLAATLGNIEEEVLSRGDGSGGGGQLANGTGSESRYSPETIALLRRLREGVICYELLTAILEHIESLQVEGAVLIFLPGWAAIFELLNYLTGHRTFGDASRFLVLPLHSQLAGRDNHRVFGRTPGGQRKIILSTNIAETSITIDDVVFVVDTCLLKRRVYCSKTNVTSYLIDWVSKSNIQQRQGRAGRLRSGTFFVLCTRSRFESLDEFKIPEILVTSLVETVLLIKYLGFACVAQFLSRCIDRPSSRAVQEAQANLREMAAFDADNRLTPLGLVLVRLPIEPRLGRMVMLAVLLGLGGPALTIAAAGAMSHELFDHHSNSGLEAAGRVMMELDGGSRLSDHLIIPALFDLYVRRDFGQYREVLNLNGLFHIQNARRQLVNTLVRAGFPRAAFESSPSGYTQEELDALTGLLVTAYYPNICLHKDKRLIQTNEGKVGIIHKGTVLYAYLKSGGGGNCLQASLTSPFFVYTEKLAMRGLITTRQMTMISHLHLLLFGVQQVEFVQVQADAQPEGVVDAILLDGWLEAMLDPEVFECLQMIRFELENLLSKVCHEPASLGELAPVERAVLDTVRNMCLMANTAVKFQLKNREL